MRPESLRSIASRWRDAEPDLDIRQETDALLGDAAALEARFSGRLTFGTAGLRAAIGAGPLRMNRLVVRQAAAGLVDYLLHTVPRAAHKGLIIGYDARNKSADFALDTARVAAARGMRAMLLPSALPTPVLAWNITRVGAVAGVMVTASHNPPADNGYKVYLDTGSQIVPPHDELIATSIAAVDPCNVPLTREDHELIEVLGGEALSEYLSFVPTVRLRNEPVRAKVAYTAMHGVGGETLISAFHASGFPAPTVVDAQQHPDPAFPTVPFPNPEEPGAMDLVIAEAQRIGADVALANDPDADRLGVAIPSHDGQWRRLSGDEVGWLLADHILRHTSGPERLVVTTLVSSSMLSKMAEAHGIHYEETFTGFKWIGHAALQHPEWRLVFGYEQALGYLTASSPLDKDGITAAVVMAEVIGSLKADKVSVEQRLDQIADSYGRHVTAETSLPMSPADGAVAVRRITLQPPSSIGSHQVASVRDYPEAGLVRLWLDEVGGRGIRIQIRPSGTEPKVKLYGEGVGVDAAELDEVLASTANLLVM